MLCKAIYCRLTFISTVFIQLPSMEDPNSNEALPSSTAIGKIYLVSFVFEVCCNCIPVMDFFSDMSISLQLVILKNLLKKY